MITLNFNGKVYQFDNSRIGRGCYLIALVLSELHALKEAGDVYAFRELAADFLTTKSKTKFKRLTMRFHPDHFKSIGGIKDIYNTSLSKNQIVIDLIFTRKTANVDEEITLLSNELSDIARLYMAEVDFAKTDN